MKYVITDVVNEDGLFQIKADETFLLSGACANIQIKKGTLGGWISDESCLAQKDECWITEGCKVYKGAVVSGSSYISGDSVIFGNVHVHNSRIMESVISIGPFNKKKAFRFEGADIFSSKIYENRLSDKEWIKFASDVVIRGFVEDSILELGPHSHIDESARVISSAIIGQFNLHDSSNIVHSTVRAINSCLGMSGNSEISDSTVELITGVLLRSADIRNCSTTIDIKDSLLSADTVIIQSPAVLVNLECEVTKPVISMAVDRYSVTITDNHIKIGCQQHTIDQWRGFDRRDAISMDGRKAAEWFDMYIKAVIAMADTRGSKKC